MSAKRITRPLGQQQGPVPEPVRMAEFSEACLKVATRLDEIAQLGQQAAETRDAVEKQSLSDSIRSVERSPARIRRIESLGHLQDAIDRAYVAHAAALAWFRSQAPSADAA